MITAIKLTRTTEIVAVGYYPSVSDPFNPTDGRGVQCELLYSFSCRQVDYQYRSGV